MTLPNREKLIRELKRRVGVRSDDELMDVLQDRGLVADQVATLEGVAEEDLIEALEK